MTSFILIVAGVLLCILNSRPDLLHTIVKIVGVAFFVSGVINVFIMINHSSKNKGNSFSRIAGWLSGIGGVLLGLAMFFYPPLFTTVLVYLFGILLILGGIVQICIMAWGYKDAALSGWLYIVPVILIVGGVIMISSDSLRVNASLMVVITGVGMILYGLNSFFAMIAAANSRSSHKAVEPATKPEEKEPERKQIESAGDDDFVEATEVKTTPDKPATHPASGDSIH